jgi:hypothetical protein
VKLGETATYNFGEEDRLPFRKEAIANASEFDFI